MPAATQFHGFRLRLCPDGSHCPHDAQDALSVLMDVKEQKRPQLLSPPVGLPRAPGGPRAVSSAALG